MNAYLIDTHVLLWWLFNDSRLSYKARQLIKSRDNSIYVSAASAWEISTKHRIGKLPEAGDIVKDLPAFLLRGRMESMEITLQDALLAGAFEYDHRDPFDRMIMAQAKLRELPIVTNDAAFNDFAENIIW